MSEKIISYEPATGSQIWEGEAGDIDAEIARAEKCWPKWAAMPHTFRIETLQRFTNGVRAAEEKLTDLIARETGKPVWEARNEVAAILLRANLAANASSERAGQRRLEGAMGSRQALRHKPHGVLAIITPHVMPAQIPVDHIIPALLAGNGVVFKPAPQASACGQLIVELFHQAGVPQDVLRCLIGGHETAQALVTHDSIRGILFSGSTQAGLSITRSCANRPDRFVALQMSGNNPIIAWTTADLPSAAALIVQSAFGMSGQHCLSARRLIVKDEMADALLSEVKRLASRLTIDHPHADPAPFMGPVADMDTADGLTESFLYLMSNGGKPLKHMQRPKDGLPFVTPAIIDVTAMAERPDVELFGPLLQVRRVASFEEAISEANNTRYGLSAALIGGSPEEYDQFWSNSRAGIVNWNRPTTAYSLAGPMGGVGLSGNHRPTSSYVADQCAYPVVSSEIEQPRAAIGIGLKQLEIVADR